ncbi:MAG: hypothetical protein AAF739_03965 [Pseudomonadota bacterium]
MPLRSVPALSTIDFETTAFQQLNARVELPQQLVPRAEGTRFNVTLTLEEEVVESRSFVLVRNDSDRASAMAQPTVAPGRQSYTFSLAPADQLSLEDIRRKMLEAKAAERTGSLALAVAVTDVCAKGDLPDGPLLVDVYLKTSETERFVRTLDGYDLRELQSGELADLPICSN